MQQPNDAYPIIPEWPPNIDLLDEAFHVKDKPNVLYAYDGKIYNPSKVEIPEHIIVHETVHLVRQNDGNMTPGMWWTNYVNKPSFRLNEEIFAHRAEWGAFCKNFKDRNDRNRHLVFMSRRLASPMYGNMCTITEAKKYIIGA